MGRHQGRAHLDQAHQRLEELHIAPTLRQILRRTMAAHSGRRVVGPFMVLAVLVQKRHSILLVASWSLIWSCLELMVV